MDKKEVGTMMQSAAKVPISELNECITCKLCRGYFIDATTIIECLHTFCRSCIVRYLETNKYCPICDVQVHKTKPLLNIRQDKTIQNLVYKLVPRLYQNEVQKRKAYYEEHPESKPTPFEESTATQFEYILAPEESVNVTLKYFGSSGTPRYLRCPSAVSVNHLKKLIRSKYELTDHNRVDVYYNQDCLNPSFSLMDILYIYSRKRKDPLDLTYKIYECRAKKPKLDSATNNSANNNNNNWKEVQLRISENGEMSITGIEDANMLALLDATENYKSDIVMNEGKNLDAGVVETEKAPSNAKVEKSAEEKTSMSSCTTSNSTKTPISSTKTSNSDTKIVISSTKYGSPKKLSSDPKKTPSELPINNTEASNNIRKHHRITVEQKQLRNMAELPKNVEISDTLNLNSELSVIPLSTTSAGCVSLSSCGETTTVFSTINKTMCSTKLEGSGGQNCGGYGEARGVLGGFESKKLFIETEKEPIKNSNLKENKNLKRKHEEDVKNPEVPQKLPKPTILNHSIGLMNLSNNHQLKKHSKINRNGEHLLRTTELTEKVPISTQNLTVNHVSIPQKTISVDTVPSKPIIINKNVSNLQITRPGTPKSGQRGGQAGNVPCYANKSIYNSVGGVNKAGEKNGDKVEGTQGKMELQVSTPAVNSTIKPSISHSIHHTQSYHTPIITPSQLPHHQHLNSLQLKQSVNSNAPHNQDKSEQRSYQSTVTSQGSIVMSQAASQVHTVTSQSKPSVATSQSGPATSQTISSSVHSPIHPSNKSSAQAASHSTPSNHQTSSSASSTIQTTPPTQSQPITTAIKTKPSTPIGYKTLRDPPKSWNSQINSQIARVNQNVKAQQLANAAAAASQVGGVNAQGGRFTGDLKSVRPAKFFKGRNMPRYLGCPASGVKPMYQLQGSSDKEKGQEQQQQPTAAQTQTLKLEKSEIKKHSIVKIDPKTLRPISEKAPETSNLSVSVSQNSQELRINSSTGDLKINTSSVSIFNPLKLQSSPKSERKSPKSPHSPKVKNSPNSNMTSSTNTTTTSPSPSNTLSPKQHRDKTSLTFTPPNPFIPNLASPTLSPNQFLYPAGGFPNYDPRFMAAYHSLLYSQRMAAAGFVAPPMPHPFGMNMGLNTATTTMVQQQLSPRISIKHSTPPKTTGQASPKSNNATTSTQISKSSPTLTPPTNKKTKESSSTKIDKSLETALNKLSQGKAVGGGTKQVGGVKQVGGNSKKKDADVVQRAGVSTPLVDSHLGLTFMGGNTFSPPTAKEVGGSTISALEKLSQNKAIEIMGGGGAGGKRDGRNSPMGGQKRDVGGKSLPSKGRASPRLQMTETTAKNVTLKRQQSPLTTDSKKTTSQPPNQPSNPSQTTNQPSDPSQSTNQPSNPSRTTNQPSDPSKNSEKALPSSQSRPPASEKPKEKKLEDNKTIGQNCSSSEPNKVSSELQTRLNPPVEAQKSSDKAEVGQTQSIIGSDQKKEVEKGSGKDQNKGQSDQSQNRLDQNQNMSDKSSSGSDIGSVDNTLKKIEADGSSCTEDSKKVSPSDIPVSVGEILDNSDIKASNSQISGKKTNTDNAVADKPVEGAAGNAAKDVIVPDETTTGNAAKSDVPPVTVNERAGNAAKSDVMPVTVNERAGNGAERSGGVGEESDKGGGEKKE